ncbi:MAG: D-alanyl-D-alanine carboxypeptidase [Candidatus Lambdaproteobacteria bacterium]|nr:D-alanyl-D-alanine carboxypeptidase [Candidatus Lambdaproteobacteria bacterium]
MPRRGRAVAAILPCLAWLLLCAGAPAALAQSPAAPRSAALPPAAQTALRKALAPLIERGGVAVGYDGDVVFVHGPGVYVPASILKLATAQAAFARLGPDYRFRTAFYLDAARNLIVKGYGDPFLVSEEWQLIGRALDAVGAFRQPLGDLVLDDAAVDADVTVDGVGDSTNPYDARLGALVVNFNTINVHVGPRGDVTSAEPQTPLTPLARELGRHLPRGEQRINLSQDAGNAARYAGELVRALLEQAGATFRGDTRRGHAPQGLTPLLVHRSSRALPEVVQGMLQYSNNFIANQLVLGLALEHGGEPARLDAGVAVLRAAIAQHLQLGPPALVLAEGSGISRRNRADLLAMLRLVDGFHPWQHLLREFGPPGRGVPGKTGNLQDVYTLAGFLPAEPPHRRPFVVMLNQRRNTRDAVFEALYDTFAPGGVTRR